MSQANVSSSRPEYLFRYAETAQFINTELCEHADVLQGYLANFACYCVEGDFRVDVGQLPGRVREYANHCEPIDASVRRVGHNFAMTQMLTLNHASSIEPLPPARLATQADAPDEESLLERIASFKMPFWAGVGFSMVPFIDLIDIIGEGARKLLGKDSDNLVLALATMGLVADLGWLSPEPASEAPNAVIAFVKQLVKRLPRGPARDAIGTFIQDLVKTRNMDGLKQLAEVSAKLSIDSKLLDRLVENPRALEIILKQGPDVLNLVVKQGNDGTALLQQFGEDGIQVLRHADELAARGVDVNLLTKLALQNSHRFQPLLETLAFMARSQDPGTAEGITTLLAYAAREPARTDNILMMAQWIAKNPEQAGALLDTLKKAGPLDGETIIRTLDEHIDARQYLKFGELAPSSRYLVNGYEYLTDEAGRVTQVTGKLRLETGVRDPKIQSAVGHEGVLGDEGGHIIANQFGGPREGLNIFPQNWQMNRGQGSEWAKMERAWADALKDSQDVSVDIKLIYDAADTPRPRYIKAEYWIGDQKLPTIFQDVN